MGIDSKELDGIIEGRDNVAFGSQVFGSVKWLKQNRIQTFICCKTCCNAHCVASSCPAQIILGWTEKGLQVWCKTCNKNVVHLDFDGKKLKAV